MAPRTGEVPSAIRSQVRRTSRPRVDGAAARVPALHDLLHPSQQLRPRRRAVVRAAAVRFSLAALRYAAPAVGPVRRHAPCDRQRAVCASRKRWRASHAESTRRDTRRVVAVRRAPVRATRPRRRATCHAAHASRCGAQSAAAACRPSCQRGSPPAGGQANHSLTHGGCADGPGAAWRA